MKSNLGRNEQLERMAKARAAVIAFLNSRETPASVGEVHEGALAGTDFKHKDVDNLLRRMALNKLVAAGHTDDAPPRLVYTKYTPTTQVKGKKTRAKAKAAPAKKRESTGNGRRKQDPPAPSTLDRPEVRVEADRVVIEHPLCRVIVELKLPPRSRTL